MSGQRLYIVRITYEAYVLASSKAEAARQQSNIERWEDYPTVETYVLGHEKLDGWTDDCSVYHSGDGDITLAKARQIDAASVLK